MTSIPHRRRRRGRRSLQINPKLLHTLSRLKYSRILLLIALFLTCGWMLVSVVKLILPDKQNPSAVVPSVPLVAVGAKPIKELVTANSEPIYNVRKTPNWAESETLQTIVNDAVKLALEKELPTEKLSISLIDVSNPNSYTHAGHNNSVPRFPASVAKLFWMVAAMGYEELGKLQDPADFHSDLGNMMRISDNDSASRILDRITNIKSGGELNETELQAWIQKRSVINSFFQKAGYEGLNLTTKNYPISSLGEKPSGRELQMWKVAAEPKSNRVTTDQAARIMYEIYTKQAISPLTSTKMAYLLTRDLDPKAWKQENPNSVEGFLSEFLPPKIYYGSKVGYTTRSRQEVAFIRTLDDQAIYILAIFGDHPTYAKDEEIFPKMSRLIFDRLHPASVESQFNSDGFSSQTSSQNPTENPSKTP